MPADALVPYITVPSAAMLLSMDDKQDLVFHEDGFQ